MDYTPSEIEKIKSEAKEYDGHFEKIDDLACWVDLYRQLNKNYYYVYDGIICYTLLDDCESCYKKITGGSREEFMEKMNELEEHSRKFQEKINKKLASLKAPEWIEKGNELIFPQKRNDWKDLIELRIESEPYGKDFKFALQVMEVLENGADFQQAYDIIKDADLSGPVYSSTISLVFNFYKKGPEFYKFIDKNPNDATIKFIEKIEKRNKEYEKELEH